MKAKENGPRNPSSQLAPVCLLDAALKISVPSRFSSGLDPFLVTHRLDGNVGMCPRRL